MLFVAALLLLAMLYVALGGRGPSLAPSQGPATRTPGSQSPAGSPSGSAASTPPAGASK